MNIVLLSGGSGKRLWPLSNDIRSKQFIKIFKKDNDTPVVLVNFNILKNISKFLQNVVVLDLIKHCKPVICFQIYSLAL